MHTITKEAKHKTVLSQTAESLGQELLILIYWEDCVLKTNIYYSM